MQSYRNKKWNAFLQTLHPQSRSLWQIARYFTKKKSPIPPLHHRGQQHYKAEDKAEILAGIFSDNHRLTIPDTPTSHGHHVETTVASFLKRIEQTKEVHHPIRYTEIQQIIQKLKIRKAPGADEITTPLLRHLSHTAMKHLTAIYNAILTTGYFPPVWKHAKVLAIPKPHKSPSDLGSYRPISFQPVLSKILERLVVKRLLNHIHTEGIIPNEQFGFKMKHSTTTQLTRLTEHITHGFNLRKHTGLVLLDLEKAFDSVWGNGQLFKIIHYHFPRYLITFLSSYLTGRTFTVTVEGCASSCHNLLAGLPQSAVLSPILFSIYTSYLPRTPYVQLAMYADDTAIFSQSWRHDTTARRLSDNLSRLTSYFEKWRLKVNANKTQAILFTKRRPLRPLSPKIGQLTITWSTEVKYLGLRLTPTLNYTEHIKGQIGKALGTMRKLFPLLGRESNLETPTKLLLYTTAIRSIVAYAAPVWCSINSSSFKQLQVLQNKCLRIIGNAPRRTPLPELYFELGVEHIRTYMLHISARI
jgi:hypothetical protein